MPYFRVVIFHSKCYDFHLPPSLIEGAPVLLLEPDPPDLGPRRLGQPNEKNEEASVQTGIIVRLTS